MAARKKTTAQATQAAPSAIRTVEKEGDEGFFSHVRSNIKGGVDVPLYACTAVVSQRNRAGKTAVLDSVRLALTGSHPIGPHFADIVGLTGDGSAPQAVLDGKTGCATFSVPSGRKSGEHGLTGELASLKPSQVAGLLPLTALRDLLTLGTAKAREELFRRFGGEQATIPTPDGLDESQLVAWTAALASSVSPDVTERLAAAGEYVRKQKRATSAEIRSLEEEAERLREAIAGEGAVTDDVLTDLREKLERHEKARAARSLEARKDLLHKDLNEGLEEFQRQTPPETQEEFDAACLEDPALANLRTKREAFDEAVAARDALPAPNALAEAVLEVRNMTVRLAEGALQTTCLCCATSGVSTPALLESVEKLEKRHAESKQARAAAEALVDSKRRALREAEEAAHQSKAREFAAWQIRVRNYGSLKERLRRLGEDYKLAVTAFESAVGGEVPAEDAETLKARLDKLLKVKVARERTSAIVGAVRRAKNDLDDLKAVETVVGETLASLIATVRTKAETAVNAWMPEGFKAALVLENAEGRPECRWEVVGTDGRSHPRGAASGAEWSALTVAIACAWSEGSQYRFLLLDDGDLAGFSADNVEHFLNTIGKAVKNGKLTQAFVAWSRPEEIPSEGWGVVSL